MEKYTVQPGLINHRLEDAVENVLAEDILSPIAMPPFPGNKTRIGKDEKVKYLDLGHEHNGS